MYTTGTGDVNLDVGANTSKAKKDIVKLAKSIVDTFKNTDKQVNQTTVAIHKLENQALKASDKISSMSKANETAMQQADSQINKVSKSVEDLQKKHEAFEATRKSNMETGEYQKLQAELASYERQRAKLDEEYEKKRRMRKLIGKTSTTPEMDNMKAQYQEILRTMEELDKKSRDIKNKGVDVSAYHENRKQLQEQQAQLASLQQQRDSMATRNSSNMQVAQDELDAVNQKIKELKKQEAGPTIADRLKSGFTGLKNVVQKGVAGAFNKLKKVAHNSLHDVNKQTKKGIWTLMKYGLGIRSLYVLFRKLRSWATEAFKGMGQKFPEVQKDLNALKNSFSTFKASIGTAFQPLLAVALPVLKTIINYATAAANAIGSLFAALTGQDYVYKATAANNDYADSVSGVGKAAKEANKQLGQYDELMVIQQDTDSSGGGGTSGADSGMNWEKVPVDDSIQNLAKRIKDAWEKADFFDIGEEIGTKIKDKLDNIKWDKLKDSAHKAGQSLATFLNGIFASEVLTSLANAIAELINSAVELGLGFVLNFEWEYNGGKLGEALSKLIEKVDEHKLAQLIYETIKGAIDFATGFFEKTDFELLGEKIGNFVKDMVQEIPEVTVKIAKLSWTIAKSAAGFVAGVNETNPFLVDLLAMIGIGKLAAGGFGIAVPLLTVAIAKVGWDLGKTIYENLDTDENGDNIIDKFVESTGIGDLAVNISDAFDDAMNVDGVFESFKTALSGYASAIKKWVTDYIIDPWKEALGIGQGASGGGGGGPKKDGESFIEGFKQGILNVVNGIGSWIDTYVIQPIHNAWDKVKGTFQIDFSVSDFVADIKAKWDAIKTWFTTNGINLADYIGDNIKGKIDNIKNAWEGWKVKKKELQAKVTGGAEKAIKTVKSAWNGFKVKAKNLKLNVTGTAEKVLNKVKEILDAVKGKAYSFKLAFQDTFTGPIISAWNAIADKINDAIDVMNKIPKVNIPHVKKLAKGGVIPPNKEFMAILGDQKQGTNIETPLETMVQAFNMALDRRDGDSSSNHEPIVLQLDGRTVAKVVWDENQKRYKQTGRYSPAY